MAIALDKLQGLVDDIESSPLAEEACQPPERAGSVTNRINVAGNGDTQ